MLRWLEGLPISEWVATSDWGYPILLSIHSIGMACVVGLLLLLAFRVLGFGKRVPLSAFDQLMPVAWAGFLLNLASGVLLFMSMAHRLVSNWPFISKMSTVVIGGAISWALWKELKRAGSFQFAAGEASEEFGVSKAARILAVVSIIAWLAAILFGRLIAYVLDAALLNGS